MGNKLKMKFSACMILAAAAAPTVSAFAPVSTSGASTALKAAEISTETPEEVEPPLLLLSDLLSTDGLLMPPFHATVFLEPSLPLDSSILWDCARTVTLSVSSDSVRPKSCTDVLP